MTLATFALIGGTIITSSFISGVFGMAGGMVLLGVLLAELYVSTGGIGYYTRLYTESFDPPATFALVACLATMAVLLNETVRRAERRASFWRDQDGARG